MSAALELHAITKRFDGVPAIDAASFTARFGEVHALLGENGAGKSSLMNVAAGLYLPDEGWMAVDGRPVSLAGPADAAALRIGMVHQHFKLIKPFTVAENVLLACRRPSHRAGLAEVTEAIRREAAALGFAIDPAQEVGTLSVAEQQRVEILKVLVAGARILILDEPTAVLTDEEAERLLETVRRLARAGAAVIMVTHKLAEVLAFADRVTVMRGGRVVAVADPKTTTAAELTTLTVGSEIAPRTERRGTPGPARLVIADLAIEREDGRRPLAGASFSVRVGEIYGVAGVGGNGQTELAEALMGVLRPSAGAITLAEAGDITAAPPAARRALGLASIPADRYRWGLAGELSVNDNVAIGHVASGRYGGWWKVGTRRLRVDAAAAIARHDVQGVRRGGGANAALLSGGNAQKLVIAREFSGNPQVVIAHSPSRGLDVRASAAVQQALCAARDAGAAVVLVGEDLDEVLALSDRVGVMSRGRIVAEFAAPADRHAVGRAMVDHA